jgi:hypothetical protein
MSFDYFRMSFVRQILSGEKLLLQKSELIRCKDMPRYNELSVEKLYKLGADQPDVLKYLPRKKDPPHQ